ncbi:hypothetical protein ACFL2Q_13870 [Thermodesulfobacteriota bacterium]
MKTKAVSVIEQPMNPGSRPASTETCVRAPKDRFKGHDTYLFGMASGLDNIFDAATGLGPEPSAGSSQNRLSLD